MKLLKSKIKVKIVEIPKLKNSQITQLELEKEKYSRLLLKFILKSYETT